MGTVNIPKLSYFTYYFKWGTVPGALIDEPPLFTGALQHFLPWTVSIQSISSHLMSLSSTVILFYFLCFSLPNAVFPSGFPTIFLYPYLVCALRATCEAYLIVLDWIIMIIFGEEHNLRNSSVCSLSRLLPLYFCWVQIVSWGSCSQPLHAVQGNVPEFWLSKKFEKYPRIFFQKGEDPHGGRVVINEHSRDQKLMCPIQFQCVFVFMRTSRVTYSKAYLESNGYSASSCFKHSWVGSATDKSLHTATLL
jgi:hypothetical protein